MQNKYYFIPIVNVDGVAMIEEQHSKSREMFTILEKRKNMGPTPPGESGHPCGYVESGVDLNRNFDYDWYLYGKNTEQGRDKPCSEFFAGK